MDIYIQQAKQYFITKDYIRAYQTIENNKALIAQDKLATALDVAACSHFMNNDFEPALKLFN